MLPEPLQRLETQYQQLVADVQSGAITIDQAQQSLTHMVEVDGAGQSWSKNVDGQFTCAPQPGQPGQPADPSNFQPASLPARAGTEELNPWANPHLMGQGEGAQPAGPGQQAPGPGGAPGGWPGDPGQQQGGVLPNQLPTPQGRPKHLGDPPDDGIVSRLKAKAGPALSSVTSKLPGDKRTLLVIVVAVAALLAITVYGRLTDDPLEGGVPTGESQPAETETDDDLGSDLPGQFPSDDGDTPAEPPESSDDGDDSAQEADTTVSELPTDERITAVVGNVTSGDRELAAANVRDTGDTSDVALSVGAFAGLEIADLAIVTAAPVTDDDGRVLQRWEIVDALNDEVYSAATVEWVVVDSEWSLISWPIFQRAE